MGPLPDQRHAAAPLHALIPAGTARKAGEVGARKAQAAAASVFVAAILAGAFIAATLPAHMGASSRLLRLLPLLQRPRDWTGTELASRAGGALIR